MHSQVNKTTLDNGVRVVTKKMPHVRSVSMGVWVNVGARDESINESGLSHFIEHMIFKGTTRRNAFQIAKQFDAIGGHTNAFTTMETTCYHAKVMDTHLNTMADILADIFLNSVFHETEVEKERPVIFQEIGMVEDNSEEYIHFLAESHYWGNHPLGRSILGTRENIGNFDAETIKDFFHRFYQPDRIVVSVAGNLHHDHILDIVNPSFGSIKPGNGFPDRIAPRTNTDINVHYRPLEQLHVCIETSGLCITDPRRYTFSLLNTIIGGNMSSRLFQEIRERRGLAYSVYSFVSSYVDAGLFGVYAGVSPERSKETISLIIQAFQELKKRQIDASELTDAKEYTKGCLMLAAESTDNQMVRLAQNEIHLGRYVHLEEIVEKIDSVTPDDIRELADDLFNIDSPSLTVLGPIKDENFYEDCLRP